MKSPIARLALLLALCASACQSAARGGAPAPVAFRTLAQGEGPVSELAGGREVVIRTAQGLERLWSQLPADAGPAPQVDFEREMVVYAAHAAIERVASDAGFLRVEVRERTSGFHLVRLARDEAPVQFVTAR